MTLTKANLVLLAVAAALAVPMALQLRGESEVFKDVARIPLLFDGFTSDNVGAIVIATPKKEQPPAEPNKPAQVAYDALYLQRVDNGYVFGQQTGDLAGAPANKDRVENDVFAHLRTIRSDAEAVVQSNATPAQLAEFGLDEAHATVIRASDLTGRNVVAELLVGRDAGGGQKGTEAVRGVFVRKSDSTDVILYEFEKFWRRDVQVEQWLDKSLLRIEPDRVQTFAVTNTAGNGVPYGFEKRDGKASWHATRQPVDVGAVRQANVEGLLQRLRYVTAQDYRMPLQRANLAQLGLQPPQIKIELKIREDGRDRDVWFAIGNQVEGKNEYYLASSESKFLMTWPAGLVTPFEVDLHAEMFDRPGAVPPPDAPDAPQVGPKK